MAEIVGWLVIVVTVLGALNFIDVEVRVASHDPTVKPWVYKSNG